MFAAETCQVVPRLPPIKDSKNVNTDGYRQILTSLKIVLGHFIRDCGSKYSKAKVAKAIDGD
jgi:hypothetical protein